MGINKVLVHLDALRHEVEAGLASICRIESSLQRLESGNVPQRPSLINNHLNIHDLQLLPTLNGSPKTVHKGPLVDRIGFLVQSFELMNHFGCVWDHMPPDRFDIILHDNDLDAGSRYFFSVEMQHNNLRRDL